MHRRLIVLVALAVSACGASTDGATTTSDGATSAQAKTPVARVAKVVGPTETTAPGAPTSEAGDGSQDSERRSGDDCSIVSRTLETAIEAYFAQNQYDITSAEQLVDEGYLRELDADFAIDFSPEVPAVVPVPGGPCDYDFDAQRTVEQSTWEDRQCWLDLISVDVAVRGYTAQVGEAPTSLEEISSVYPDFPTGWPNLELGANGEIIDLIEGGCTVVDNLEVFGGMWVDAPPQCAVDVWTLAWSLHLTDRYDDETVSLELLISEGLIEQRSYLYGLTAGQVSNVEGSGCPSMEPSEQDVADDAADACAVERRTLETAAEAFFAQSGGLPVSVDEMVEAGYLIPPSEAAWELRATGDELEPVSFEPIAGGRCDLGE